MKNSDFRQWVYNVYSENTKELEDFNQKPYKLNQYFQKYKWWLRTIYKKEKSWEDRKKNL